MHPGISSVIGSLRKASRFIGSEIWHINTRGLSRLHALLVRRRLLGIFRFRREVLRRRFGAAPAGAPDPSLRIDAV